ncbi:hypothetical protein P4S73_05050 [Paraglaciecola sp. Hal342]
MSLARDRVGKKPLYFGRSNDFFCFSSELKALKVILTLPQNWTCRPLGNICALIIFPRRTPFTKEYTN